MTGWLFPISYSWRVQKSSRRVETVSARFEIVSVGFWAWRLSPNKVLRSWTNHKANQKNLHLNEIRLLRTNVLNRFSFKVSCTSYPCLSPVALGFAISCCGSIFDVPIRWPSYPPSGQPGSVIPPPPRRKRRSCKHRETQLQTAAFVRWKEATVKSWWIHTVGVRKVRFKRFQMGPSSDSPGLLHFLIIFCKGSSQNCYLPLLLGGRQMQGTKVIGSSCFSVCFDFFFSPCSPRLQLSVSLLPLFAANCFDVPQKQQLAFPHHSCIRGVSFTVQRDSWTATLPVFEHTIGHHSRKTFLKTNTRS